MAPIVLLVLDGWGIGNKDISNPIFVGEPKNINHIRTHYLIGALQASGIAVGLPWGEEGNSEVGHLTIGAGKRIYQYYPRISLDIREGGFFINPALKGAFEHAKKNSSSVHLLGLLTESNIHASLEHIEALLELAKREGEKQVFLHLFSDGKDSRPRSVAKLLQKVQGYIESAGVGEVASLSGRYYALDRAGHWDRTETTYNMLTGGGISSTDDLPRWIEEQYEDGLEDQFIQPVLMGPEMHPIKNNDALIFFDFREDSIRQLASAFITKEFSEFRKEPIENLYVATMTDYSRDFDVAVAYGPEKIVNPLGRVLAENGKSQIRITETEKYAHVTYFFNGYRDEPFENEYRILVPSRKTPNVSDNPQMMAAEIGTRVIDAIEGGGVDIVIANLPNADIVSHTGNFDATVGAVQAIDIEIGRILEAVTKSNSTLIITADHGHAERMRDPLTGVIENRHAETLVPFYLVGKGYENSKSENDAYLLEQSAVGILSDVAPTMLELLKIAKPKEMTGQSLLKSLR